MSDSVWPHRRQPTRLPHPWESPGKNTGVGCHCLLQCMKVKSESEVAQSCLTLRDPMDSLWPHGLQPTRLLRPWGFPGKSTGAGCHCLLHQDSLLGTIFQISSKAFFYSRFGFTAKLRGRFRDFLYIPYFDTWIASRLSASPTRVIILEYTLLSYSSIP